MPAAALRGPADRGWAPPCREALADGDRGGGRRRRPRAARLLLLIGDGVDRRPYRGAAAGAILASGWPPRSRTGQALSAILASADALIHGNEVGDLRPGGRRGPGLGRAAGDAGPRRLLPIWPEPPFSERFAVNDARSARPRRSSGCSPAIPRPWGGGGATASATVRGDRDHFRRPVRPLRRAQPSSSAHSACEVASRLAWTSRQRSTSRITAGEPASPGCTASLRSSRPPRRPWPRATPGQGRGAGLLDNSPCVGGRGAQRAQRAVQQWSRSPRRGGRPAGPRDRRRRLVRSAFAETVRYSRAVGVPKIGNHQAGMPDRRRGQHVGPVCSLIRRYRGVGGTAYATRRGAVAGRPSGLAAAGGPPRSPSASALDGQPPAQAGSRLASAQASALATGCRRAALGVAAVSCRPATDLGEPAALPAQRRRRNRAAMAPAEQGRRARRRGQPAPVTGVGAGRRRPAGVRRSTSSRSRRRQGWRQATGQLASNSIQTTRPHRASWPPSAGNTWCSAAWSLRPGQAARHSAILVLGAFPCRVTAADLL